MLSRQRGAAAIVAVLAMTLLMVIGGGFACLSLTDVKAAGDYRDGVMAQYLAEAGVRRALCEMKKSEAGEWHGETRAFASGNYDVKPVVNQGIYRVITAVGTVNHATRKVVVTATSATAYHYVAYSGGNMNLTGVAVGGDIGSNENITLTGGTISGSVNAVGDIYADDVVAPSQKTGVTPQPLPSFTAQIRQNYKTVGKAANIYENPSLGYASWGDFNNLDKKVFYVESKYPLLLAFENIKGPGIIYCTEAIRISGATIANDVVLISEKNITITEGFVDKALLIAGGDVDVKIADFHGSIMAKGYLAITGNIYGNPKLEKITSLTNPSLPFTWNSDKMEIIAWNSHE